MRKKRVVNKKAVENILFFLDFSVMSAGSSKHTIRRRGVGGVGGGGGLIFLAQSVFRLRPDVIIVDTRLVNIQSIELLTTKCRKAIAELS